MVYTCRARSPHFSEVWNNLISGAPGLLDKKTHCSSPQVLLLSTLLWSILKMIQLHCVRGPSGHISQHQAVLHIQLCVPEFLFSRDYTNGIPNSLNGRVSLPLLTRRLPSARFPPLTSVSSSACCCQGNLWQGPGLGPQVAQGGKPSRSNQRLDSSYALVTVSWSLIINDALSFCCPDP